MANMSVSKDTQELIISSLLKNSYLFSICRTEMTDGYFSDPSCKIIYKSLSVYYKKYNKIPSLNEILITIEDCYIISAGVSLVEVKSTCQRLYNLEEQDENFIKDKITDFIRKVRSNNALSSFLSQLKTNPNLESDSIVNDLAKSLEVQLSSTKVFSMTNMDQVREARMSAVGDENNSKIVKSILGGLNSCLLFGGFQPSTVNMIVGAPNSGKSMYLVNEGVNAAKQGFKVIHIFIGDMVEYDGYIRYLSCASGYLQNNLIMMSVDKQQEVVKFCNQQYNDIFNNIKLLAYPSESLKVEQLIEDIVRFEKQLNMDFDMIIIDYPDNLIQDGKSMYQDGGTLYSYLEKLSRMTKSVVLVASQPPRAYWSQEILPLEAASESSKKQMVVDIMITMGKPFRGANYGSIYIAKARKGEVGRILRFKSEFAKCYLEEVDENTYNLLKASAKAVNK